MVVFLGHLQFRPCPYSCCLLSAFLHPGHTGRTLVEAK